ncbi:MAG: hypothetical protein ACK45H_04840 [Bacteroidota bacterium]
MFIVQLACSQSKKEQIERLTFQVDSLNGVVNQQNATISEAQKEKLKLAEEKKRLEKDNSVVKNDLTDRESTIKNLNATLQKKEKETNALRDSLRQVYTKNKVLPMLKSAIYAGNYSFEYDNGPAGSLQMYFDGKEDYYFYLDYVKGPPSYNMGTLEGIMKIYGNRGVFNASINEGDTCKIIFDFDENGVFIKQYSDDTACGFGHNVFISEYYIKDYSENNRIQPSENGSGIYTESTNQW